MAYDGYDGSAAYDLSRFETHESYAVEQQENQPRLRVVKRAGAAYRPAVAPIRIIAIMLAVMAVITLMIYNRVLLTELNDDISTGKKELTILQSENVRLQSELEQAMSLDSLEASIAGIMNEMGMTKITQDNVKYVMLADEEAAAASDREKSGLAGWIDGVVEIVKAYLGRG